jgi:hypothetical protein
MGRKKDFDEILSQLTEALAEPDERQPPTQHHDPQPSRASAGAGAGAR